MRIVKLEGKSKEEIFESLSTFTPSVKDKVEFVYSHMEHHNKREIWDYQAALLWVMAEQYNQATSNIMEFGTCWGWSAAIIANAAPAAHLKTLTPNPNHAKISAGQLARYKNVQVLERKSTDLLEIYTGPKLDMLFVDGDHDNVILDLPWWNWLKPGGLMLHHDYTPKGAPRETPVVYNALNLFAERVRRRPDVLMIDDQGTGMAGWYKRKEDNLWHMQPPPN